jgi:elongation factor G
LVGPYLSGKTSLLEALLFATGAITRKGSVRDGNTVADSSPEARARRMSVEVSAASCEFLGERWTFLDCPGSVELAQEVQNALSVVDAAVVVCDPEPTKTLTLAPLLKFLDDRKIPHMLFINKMDTAMHRVRDVLAALQAVSARPLVLRQIPIRSSTDRGDETTGYVDLVSERAYRYKPGHPSDLISIPDTVAEEEKTARQEMLESLADFDDKLLEQLLEDSIPSKEEIYQQISKDLAEDLIVPVLLGAAERDHGVHRLLKALRHDVPGPEAAVKRFGIEPGGSEAVAAVFKTYHQPHTGKLSLARILSGKVQEGMTLNGMRVGGVVRMQGQQATKLPSAEMGEVVALARMDEVHTGTILSASGKAGADFAWPTKLSPVYSLAIDVENRADEVKLTAALAKLVDEDPSLSVEHNAQSHELILWGQGEIHLQIAFDRLRTKYNLPAKWHRPQVGTRRRSGAAPRSTRATSASRAGTASSATCMCASSRCRAARASSSRTRWSAASSRATSSPRWRRASASSSTRARSASPWSTSRWRCSTASTTRSTAPTWPSRRRGAWRCPRACRSAIPCCSSRSARCRSACPTSSPTACTR